MKQLTEKVEDKKDKLLFDSAAGPSEHYEMQCWKVFAMCVSAFAPPESLRLFVERFLLMKNVPESWRCLLLLHQTQLAGDMVDLADVTSKTLLETSKSIYSLFVPGHREQRQVNQAISIVTDREFETVTLPAMSNALGWSDDDDDDSEEEPEKQDGPSRKNSASGETSDDEQQWADGTPFFGEILADFQDQGEPDTITVAKGEKVVVANPISTNGWLLVKRTNAEYGYIPETFVSPFKDTWVSMHDFAHRSDDELDLAEGDQVLVLAQDPDDDKYLKVFDTRGHSGYVPVSCLRAKSVVKSPGGSVRPPPAEEITPLPEPAEDLDVSLEAGGQLTRRYSSRAKSVIKSPVGSVLSPTPEEEIIPLPEPAEDLDLSLEAIEHEKSRLEAMGEHLTRRYSRAKSVMTPPVGSVLSPSVMKSPVGSVLSPSVMKSPVGSVRSPSVMKSPVGSVRSPSVMKSPVGSVLSPRYSSPAPSQRTGSFASAATLWSK